MDAIVVEGTEARQLAAAPGHLRTSAIPGQAGVSVVIGRRLTHGAPMRRLADLDPGDRITVTNGQGPISYRAEGAREVAADDASAFVDDEDALLLVTADPSPTSTNRLVVTALPVDDVHPAGARDPRGPITAAELGLEGDASAAIGVLVWTQALLLASAASVWLRRRWGRRLAWSLAGPLAAAALWGVYEHLGLLLPAAL